MSPTPPPEPPPSRIAWPTYLTGGAVILGVLVDQLFHTRDLPDYLAIPGGLIAAGSLAYMAWAIKTLRWHNTPIEANRPARTLVMDGPYNATRNPIYISHVLFTLGLGMVLGSRTVVLLTPLLGVALHYLSVEPEERHLRKKFGREYDQWASDTPRWFWRNL